MALDLGVHVYEKATAVSTPVLADVSIPFVVGAAPAHSASDPAKANVPVLATSWDEAVAQLGFSYDWKKYPLCEFMYSHFHLYGRQPVVFCNVLDSSRASMKDSAAGDGQTAVPVVEHQASIPFDAIASTIQVSTMPTSEPRWSWTRTTAFSTTRMRMPVWWSCWMAASTTMPPSCTSSMVRSSRTRWPRPTSWRVWASLTTA